ncbi:MAG: glycosyl transferase family 1 [Porphyromonadaceae bacterium CG2_30_38_12]|nr:MAG: glycosyl transferase family 1 [Porphyromonadaceae bacterium CG2_30_38_12]
MKIVIVGTTYPYRGGLASFNERLARQFKHEGHEVEVFTFTLQYPSFLFPGVTQLSAEPQPADLKITRSINSMYPLSWIATGNKIKQLKPDRVIFCYWMAFMAPCFGTIARMVRSSKTKNIALIHNMIPHEPTLLDRLFPSYFVQAMDGFVAMAASVEADIRHFDKSNKPIAISPHPIYDHYGAPLQKQQAALYLGLREYVSYILFFGFIRDYKGLDLLLEAFADERLRAFPLKLIVAGEFYENPEPYLSLIARFKLENHVVLRTHFIPDSEVRNYFSVADIVAQPYRTATQSGVSQIAYHFEKPMLVTNVGGLSEIVPHNQVGYVVEVQPKQIADALVDFYINNRSEKFIKNIQVEKQKYAWSKMTAAINALKV